MNRTYFISTEFHTQRIYMYGSLLMVPIGLTLNIFQFIVFRAEDFKRSNIGFLMNSLVVSDSLALFWNFVIYQYLPSIGSDISLFSSVSCALISYLSRVIQQIPLFFQAFISFVNYLSVSSPNKFAKINKKIYLIFSFSTILLVVSILNLPSSLRYLQDEISSTSSNNLFRTCRVTNIINIISTIETALLRSVLPFLLINTLNILTIIKLVKSKLTFNFNLESEKRFASILAILGVIFFVFNFPLSCLQITQIFYQYIYKYPYDSDTMVNIRFLHNCSRAFAWIYYGIGFFINIIFNKIFQKNFVRLTMCRKVNNVSNIVSI